MRRYLLESYTVRLEGLGTFTMKVRSTGKGVDTKEEVSIAQITSVALSVYTGVFPSGWGWDDSYNHEGAFICTGQSDREIGCRG